MYKILEFGVNIVAISIKKIFIFVLNTFNIIFKNNNCIKKILRIIYRYFSNIKISFKLSTKLVIFYITILLFNI